MTNLLCYIEMYIGIDTHDIYDRISYIIARVSFLKYFQRETQFTNITKYKEIISGRIRTYTYHAQEKTTRKKRKKTSTTQQTHHNNNHKNYKHYMNGVFSPVFDHGLTNK